MSDSAETRNCPICNCDNRHVPRSSFSVDDWNLKQCEQCQLLYLENPITYEQLVDEFAWTKTVKQEAVRRAARRRLTGWFRHHWKQARLRWLPHYKGRDLIHDMVEQGDVLDVGCSEGNFLKGLDDRFTPHGIEIDHKAAQVAGKYVSKHGGKIHQADALSSLRQMEESQFDAVVMQSYLEHEVEPLEVLRETRRVLRPQGFLMIKVPNLDCWNRRLQGHGWPGFRFPDHVNYFTPRTIREVIERAELKIARFKMVDKLPSSDNLWVVAQRAA